MPHCLIVSHGQPSDPDVGETEIAALARDVARHCDQLTVSGVTLAGDGIFEAAVQNAPPESVIFPMFMADGWFTKVQLPKRLGTAPLRILPPFGTQPELVGLAADWLKAELSRENRRIEDTALVVLGHGSGRSPRPAEVTDAFGQDICAKLPFAALHTGFVEQEPSLETALNAAGETSICLPFFAARRGHMLDDVPEALEATNYAGLCLDPIGLCEAVPAFIAKVLQDATGAT